MKGKGEGEGGEGGLASSLLAPIWSTDSVITYVGVFTLDHLVNIPREITHYVQDMYLLQRLVREKFLHMYFFKLGIGICYVSFLWILAHLSLFSCNFFSRHK